MRKSPSSSAFHTPTPEAISQLKELISDATYASLATLSPDEGYPICSRAGMSTLGDGTPIIYVSGLAAHTQALLADPRCSLLVGETGKGDPLTHARATLVCVAAPLSSQGDIYAEARARYLGNHPKAKLYADFADFMYFTLRPIRAHYVAGFGRAYVIDGDTVLGAAV